MKMPSRMSGYLLPIMVAAAMSGDTFSPTPERIEAKEPVKPHGGAGRNIHKNKKHKSKRKSK